MNTNYFNRIVAVYGIGVDEFLDLFAAQGHRCAVCGWGLVLFSSHRPEQPVVDHDHTTGAVRGILCSTCNIGVGWLEKNPERTVQCVDYLEGTRRAIHKPRPTDEQRKTWTSKDYMAFRRANKDKRRPAQVRVLEAAKKGKLGRT